MTSPSQVLGVPIDAGGLVGRERELALVDELLDDVDARGSALVVRGEPGSGKSALLVEAKRRADELGMPILNTSGAPFETQMPFAGLQQLLRPLVAEREGLPERQREALAVAFRESDVPTTATYLIALATLDLLAERATKAPLLLAVEDAHWLDVASVDILAFIARRVEMEPIFVLFTTRDGAGSRIDEASLPELRLEPLDDVSAAALLDACAPELASETRQRVLDEAGGNPLALVELPRSVSSDEVGALSATVPLPLTERLESAFAGRVSEVPPVTRSLLVVAALDEGADLRGILAATSLVANRAVTIDDVSPAETTGLLSIQGHVVRFRHPLVRAAIYHAARSAERQAAHRALAEVHADDADRSVWHRAEALTGPDEHVVAELEAAADRALRRGAPAAAAAALEKAARLTDTAAGAGRLLVRAAEIELELGRTGFARNLLMEANVLHLERGEQLQLVFLLEASDQESWSSAARVASFAEIANQMAGMIGSPTALRALRTVALSCWWGNPAQETRDLVVAAAERLEVAEDDPDLLAVLASADPVKRGAVVVERISRMTPDPTADPAVLNIVGLAATSVWAFDVALGFLSTAVDGLRKQGRLGLLAQALVTKSWAALHLAKGTLALSAADEGSRLARETGQLRWALAADLATATVAGERGDHETARVLADRAETELLPIGAQPMLSLVQFARGRYAVAHQLYVEGFEQLQRILDPDDVAYHPYVGAWGLSDLVEAAAHSGKMHEARRYLEQLEWLAAETSGPLLRAGLSYAKPLLAPDGEAEDLYQAALNHDLATWPCSRGRLLLNYGRWLRRHRRVAESRAPLRAARETFDALAFDGLAEVARQELRASGETSIRRTPDARDQLTPQELQITQLAAAGLSNREIGQRLYLSHRTVGSHLYRIFPKLGVSSRSELGGVLSASSLTQSQFQSSD
jgi:DNA-binding CsgD family transcriptional regulator